MNITNIKLAAIQLWLQVTSYNLSTEGHCGDRDKEQK
jgi:hypothetical protein